LMRLNQVDDDMILNFKRIFPNLNS
jgi:hypothetical protein